MSQQNDSTEAKRLDDTDATLAAEEVRAYLRRNPDLLANDPDLIAALIPPSQSTGRNVVDMQHFMIGRLQNHVRMLRDIQSDLIEASSLNSLAREQVHAATLKLLDARSFEHMIEYTTSPDGLARLLGIRAATLCIETATGVSGIGIRGVRVLEPGGVDRILGAGERCKLVPHVRGSRGLYGNMADEVHSEALVRLDFSPASPPGLLALGGFEPDQFHPDQAVDLLEFLADVVERCVRQWLDLPPAR
ncbi:DUF484 family protein [Parvibaculum sp.]|uniref:DUF484 family protein n=1 Tax=Parvibaculum sp. TaxID=2024848 RepID=UPI0027302280|nr:DUF484 family protein [Parvibaculum sp.]MDP1627354.1 DUF484 family protein [Parvibaculum sp.]MDP2149433.1 DUF484 family protein [Parvibaculum sp.]MDP3327966.1 DUF484 family protein [Parvibaculum sp.]